MERSSSDPPSELFTGQGVKRTDYKDHKSQIIIGIWPVAFGISIINNIDSCSCCVDLLKFKIFSMFCKHKWFYYITTIVLYSILQRFLLHRYLHGVVGFITIVESPHVI